MFEELFEQPEVKEEEPVLEADFIEDLEPEKDCDCEDECDGCTGVCKNIAEIITRS